jgi:hypothetical protein
MLALAPALAQDIDAHGFTLAAFDADARDPLTLQRPGDFQAGSAFIGGLFEYARTPLVAESPDGERLALLDNLFALNLSAGFAPHERFRLDVTAPLYGFTGVELDGSANTGLGVGDTRVALMGVVLRGEDTGGFSLALVPHVDLPSGVFHPYLGRNAVAGGGVLAASLETGPITVTANAGYQVEQPVQIGNLVNSDAVLAGLGVGAMIDDTLGINAEVRGDIPVEGNGVGTTGLPAEALVSLRYAEAGGAHFTGGAAAGLTQGAGASQFRVFVGGGFGATGGPRDADGDGIVDRDDACPDEPEVLNGLDDTDGCPDQRPELRAWASWNGAPMVGAELVVDGPVTRTVTTEAVPFRMEVDPGSTWKGTATWGPCLSGEKVQTVDASSTDLIVELERETYGEMVIRVLDPTGEQVDQAVVEFRSDTPTCVPDRAMRTDAQGVLRVGVGRGKHEVLVRANGRSATVPFETPEAKSKELVVLLGL